VKISLSFLELLAVSGLAKGAVSQNIQTGEPDRI